MTLIELIDTGCLEGTHTLTPPAAKTLTLNGFKILFIAVTERGYRAHYGCGDDAYVSPTESGFALEQSC